MTAADSYTQKHLAHTIVVVDAAGSAHKYTMTIATVTVSDGVVTNVLTEPYMAECEGVRYHDGVYRIVIGQPLPPDWQC